MAASQIRVTRFLMIFFLVNGLAAKEALSAPFYSEENGTGYTLLNPMPQSQLGEMHSDRPTKAAGPFTVGPGHFQLEMGVLQYTHGEKGRSKIENRLDFGNTNFRIGLSKDLEFDILPDFFVWRELEKNDNSGTGFGNTSLRLKYSFYRNEPSETFLALMPYLVIPTGTNRLGSGGFGGGVALPFFQKLPGNFMINVMPSAAVMPDTIDDGTHVELSNSAALMYSFQKNLIGFLELYSAFSSEEWSDWIGTVDVGMKYLMTPDFQLNLASFIGFTDKATDFTLIFGFVRRF